MEKTSEAPAGRRGALLEGCADGPVVEPRPVCHPFHLVVHLRPVKDWEDDPKTKPTRAQPPLCLAMPSEASIGSLMALASVALERRHIVSTEKGAEKSGAFTGLPKWIKEAAAEVREDNELWREELRDVLRRHPVAAPVHLAVVLRFEQCWLSRGYVRGDLLHAATLWPQEELAIEIFQWDRRRLEREQSAETGGEFSQSGTFTVRASREIASKVQLEMGGEAYGEGKAGITIPIEEIPINLDGKLGARFNGKLAVTLEGKSAELSEATRTASQTYRETRKTRVLESAEFGRETRTTRKLRNPNACHPVTYYTFEILEDFEVRTSPSQAELVALIPLPDFASMDEAWVLANEFPLRRALMDPIYERGFEAAKKLQSARLFRLALAPPPVTPEPAASTEERDVLRDAIVDLIARLVTTSGRLAAASYSDDDIWPALNRRHSRHDAARQRVGRYATKRYVLAATPGIFDRVRALEEEASDDPSTSTLILFQRLRTFLEGLRGTTLMNLVSRPLRLESFPLLVLPWDDCGLLGALSTANKEVARLEQAVLSEVGAAALPGGAASTSAMTSSSAAEYPADPIERAVDQRYALDVLADARVEFTRLVDHLEGNRDYYLTALYSATGRRGAAEILRACPHAAGLVEPRLLGFHNGAAIFPLSTAAREERNAELLDELLAQQREAEASARTDFVTLPTAGTVTTARVEPCTACEVTVAAERAASVRVAAAKAEQEELEAARLRQRLAADPPLLDDPEAPAPVLRVELRQPEGD